MKTRREGRAFQEKKPCAKASGGNNYQKTNDKLTKYQVSLKVHILNRECPSSWAPRCWDYSGPMPLTIFCLNYDRNFLNVLPTPTLVFFSLFTIPLELRILFKTAVWSCQYPLLSSPLVSFCCTCDRNRASDTPYMALQCLAATCLSSFPPTFLPQSLH